MWHIHFVLDVMSTSILMHPSYLPTLMWVKFSLHLACPRYAWQLKTNSVIIGSVTENGFGHHMICDKKWIRSPQDWWPKNFSHQLSITKVNNRNFLVTHLQLPLLMIDFFAFAWKNKLASIWNFLNHSIKSGNLSNDWKNKISQSLNFLRHCWKNLVTNFQSPTLVIKNGDHIFRSAQKIIGLPEIILVVWSKVVFNLMIGKKNSPCPNCFGNAQKI